MKSKKTFAFLISIGTFIILVFLNTGCSLISTTRTKNLVYRDSTAQFPAQKLDVYKRMFSKKPKPVFIFIHGGNWNSGRKEQYNIIARNLAAKGIITVIIDYPLSPSANYKEMAQMSAIATKWTYDNISQYHGDPNRLFISGHSAGGHLASLITVDNSYFEELGLINPIKGAFLIDPAGLDMYDYLKKRTLKPNHTYSKTFTTNENSWKDASTIAHLHDNMPPIVILRGARTYESISTSNEVFMKEVQAYAPDTRYIIQKRKKHIPMILQFFNPWNKNFRVLKKFIRENSNE